MGSSRGRGHGRARLDNGAAARGPCELAFDASVRSVGVLLER